VYFNQAPVLSVSTGGGAFAGFGGGGANVGQNITPMAVPLPLSPWDGDSSGARGARVPATGRQFGAQASAQRDSAARRQAVAERGEGFGGGAGGTQSDNTPRPRVVLRFPSNPDDMLLSGTLAGGQALANKAQLVDVPLGQGHVVMFAIRPFWRWQTQGTYFLGFNAILNWNDLDAGKAAAPVAAARTAEGR
jgi:hypothetical protein